MKMSIEQLKALGFMESSPGLWTRSIGLSPQVKSLPTVVRTNPKRIRQSTKPLMNKLEQEWFDHLKATFPLRAFYPQTTRFKLGNGIWYKPDVTCPYFDGVFTCWEVKGPHSFRGGFENLKVAANKYPEFKWVLVWKEHGAWKEQHVLP